MVKALQQQVKDRGLWALILDEELGGPGFGQLRLALINEILGRYPAAPGFFGTAAPDTGNMELLARNVLQDHRPHEGLWPTEYYPHKREAARKKFESLFTEDPELERYADGIAKYMANRNR